MSLVIKNPPLESRIKKWMFHPWCLRSQFGVQHTLTPSPMSRVGPLYICPPNPSQMNEN